MYRKDVPVYCVYPKVPYPLVPPQFEHVLGDALGPPVQKYVLIPLAACIVWTCVPAMKFVHVVAIGAPLDQYTGAFGLNGEDVGRLASVDEEYDRRAWQPTQVSPYEFAMPWQYELVPDRSPLAPVMLSPPV